MAAKKITALRVNIKIDPLPHPPPLSAMISRGRSWKKLEECWSDEKWSNKVARKLEAGRNERLCYRRILPSSRPPSTSPSELRSYVRVIIVSILKLNLWKHHYQGSSLPGDRLQTKGAHTTIINRGLFDNKYLVEGFPPTNASLGLFFVFFAPSPLSRKSAWKFARGGGGLTLPFVR